MSFQERFRDVIRRIGLYSLVRPVLQARRYLAWVWRGKTGAAPDALKERLVRDYARRYCFMTLIETGTYRGDMLAAVEGSFDVLYSIELSPELHLRAVRRFKGKPKIRLLQGDSAQVLPEVLSKLAKPALFWLDAHYSAGVTARAFADTPIRAELAAVLAHPVSGHVILIDDARQFSPEFGYPTLEELEAFVFEQCPTREFIVEHDIIRIL